MAATRTNFYPGEHANILVAGDVMLDRYVFGSAGRISPEAPVPVVRVDRVEERPGGAANVAANISSLGVQVTLVGITGDDGQAGFLESALADVCYRCYRLPGASTITKLRVLSQNQQLLRLDYEEEFPANAADRMLEIYAEQLRGATLVVLSDYAKGSLARVETLIGLAREHGLPVIIDPKGADFTRYRNASVLTPNYREFESVAGESLSEDEVCAKARSLCDELSLDAVLITRGDRGMTLVEGAGGEIVNLPAEAHEVFDVTGAGDTVIAMFASALASGYGYREAIGFANAAAGIAVEKLGAATVSAAELNARSGRPAAQKRLQPEELLGALERSRRRGEKIVMTNGCFDLLHAGHVECLEQARALGDRLVVAVNDDASVRRLKGAGRPLQDLDKRLKVLAGLEAVDWLVVFPEDTPERLVQLVNPDLLVKGGDYAPEQVAGAGHVRQQGGDVITLPLVDGCSTSGIVDAIRKTGRGPA
ncbi:MAG: bifunctional D-glycero-beta-D-manno-heptose-7-phosphate kinase/D-glycero-beta-D-manno-heptose 1-phosphate adenylyltransferase HldE [Gammaproteobacteria bacterium]|nr:bifunctional D-glycero-beta-D-manno-heptose-7-phosphate kinase/D-glycero-beta-D-manno-heptose 1-phosphate adenylyltransferase HldE [Gammaproteobacteria bacterium]